MLGLLDPGLRPNVSRSPANRAHRCSSEILPQVPKPLLMALATCLFVGRCLEGADRLVQRGVRQPLRLHPVWRPDVRSLAGRAIDALPPALAGHT